MDTNLSFFTEISLLEYNLKLRRHFSPLGVKMEASELSLFLFR